MTTEEYLRTPESVTPTELVYGRLRVAESPTPQHQTIVLDLALALRDHVRERHLGEIWIAPLDVILDPVRHLVVQPDLFFISNDRRHILTDRVRGAPDLIVEVLSPHPRIGALDERLRWFAEYGVGECWLVHQITRVVEVLTFAEGQIDRRARYGAREPIVSRVLPDLGRGLDSMLSW